MNRLIGLLAATALVIAACGDGDPGPLRLYTSVTEATVTAVVDQFEADTGRKVDVFRAPTGELAARIAAEQREGGLQADILWLTDPLTMQQYAADGVLREWERRYINAALRLSEGNLSHAARLLGINRTTLYSRLQRIDDSQNRG